MTANLFTRLADRFPEDRRRIFLETEDGTGLTFAELLDRAGRVASLLRASGVAPGDRVVVKVEKSVAQIGLYLGVLQAGAVYVPLNPAYTAAEVGYFIGDAAPRVVVCTSARHGAGAAGRGGLDIHPRARWRGDAGAAGGRCRRTGRSRRGRTTMSRRSSTPPGAAGAIRGRADPRRQPPGRTSPRCMRRGPSSRRTC